MSLRNRHTLIRVSEIRVTAAALVCMSLFAFTSCYGSWNFFYKGNDVDERTKSLTILSDRDEDFEKSGISKLGGKYTVLVMTDLHFGNDKKKVETEKLYNWLTQLKGSENFPAFALSLGDSVDMGFLSEYKEYISFCNKLQNDYGIKLVLNSCGNHDIYQNNWDNWENYCYPHTSFYKFQTEKFSWYSLDTASGTVGAQQYRHLKNDFSHDNRRKIIFTHYPFIHFNPNCANMAETTERNKLISDFMKNDVICVLGGHNHRRFYEDVGFKDYGIESFGYSGVWGLLHVDENEGTAWLEYIGG